MLTEFNDIRDNLAEEGEQPNFLLENPINKVGFLNNCKIPKQSVTKTLTIELEEKRI